MEPIRRQIDMIDFHTLRKLPGAAVSALQDDAGAVFRGDDSFKSLFVPGFHAVGDEVGLNHAIWIEDVDKEFSRAMHAHAGEIGGKIVALAAELMTYAAILGEHFPAVAGV